MLKKLKNIFIVALCLHNAGIMGRSVPVVRSSSPSWGTCIAAVCTIAGVCYSLQAYEDLKQTSNLLEQTIQELRQKGVAIHDSVDQSYLLLFFFNSISRESRLSFEYRGLDSTVKPALETINTLFEKREQCFKYLVYGLVATMTSFSYLI